MITVKLDINLPRELQSTLQLMQAQQSPIIRSAYKAAELGLAEISVREDVTTKYRPSTPLDSWFIQSAVKSGMGMFSADYNSGRGPRIFGGKANFAKRARGQISSAEWKRTRLLPLYVVGEAPQKGNRKFKFSPNLTSVVFKPRRGESHTIPLPKLRKNYDKLLTSAFTAAQNKQLPITVSLTPTSISFSFDDTKLDLSKASRAIKNRYAGIDMNPNYIGISVFDADNLVATKLFKLSELTGKGASAAKLQHETREVGHAIGAWLNHHRVDKLFLEELKFKQGCARKGKSYNRLTQNNWKRSALESTLSKYYKLYKVNAAYTSTIGNILHPELPDAIAASTAVARRGYRLIVVKNKQFYPELVQMRVIEDRWKETAHQLPFATWVELHSWLQKTGLKYRGDPPDESLFRKFASGKSRVYHI